MPRTKGNEIELFAAALLRSVEEMKRGERAVVHTPEKIAGRKAEALGASESGYRWVKLKKHCEATGDTPDAVHARRRKRIWTDGVQCRIGPDGNLYVNPEAYNRWIEAGTPGVPEDRRREFE